MLGNVVGLYCNICGLWFWLVFGFHELVIINMWMMMNMWLVIVIYCDLWFTIMVVIYCEKMGSVWYICIYIWNACVDGMQKTKKIKFLSLCRGQWPRPSAKKGPLPRALAIALGKDFFKNPENFFGAGPRQRFLKENSKKNYFFAEGRPSVNNFFFKKNLCRGPLQ